jgi:hypothetical protein
VIWALSMIKSQLISTFVLFFIGKCRQLQKKFLKYIYAWNCSHNFWFNFLLNQLFWTMFLNIPYFLHIIFLFVSLLPLILILSFQSLLGHALSSSLSLPSLYFPLLSLRLVAPGSSRDRRLDFWGGRVGGKSSMAAVPVAVGHRRR